MWCILCKTAEVPFLRYLQAERNKVHHAFLRLGVIDSWVQNYNYQSLMATRNLDKAKVAKKDEFYTQLVQL